MFFYILKYKNVLIFCSCEYKLLSSHKNLYLVVFTFWVNYDVSGSAVCTHKTIQFYTEIVVEKLVVIFHAVVFNWNDGVSFLI